MDSRVEMILRVIDAAWRLVETLRSTHPDTPYEDLHRALVALDVHSGVDAKPPQERPSSAGLRVWRSGLVEGQEYQLHAPGISPDPIPFVYLGPAREDSAKEMDMPSFWMKRGDKVEKWFYADAGLEQYSKHGVEPWLHKENWVGRLAISQSQMKELLDGLSKPRPRIETDEENFFA